MNTFWYRVKECWRLTRQLVPEVFRMVRGVWKLGSLPEPRVSIFGGSRVDMNHPYAQQAREMAQKLTDHNISIITGGGPGIMQAAGCGVPGGHMKSMGISLITLNEPIIGPCSQELIKTHYFWSRKWLLTHYSSAFIVFPGGLGTLDEIGEITTLMQTKQIKVEPIVLIGTDYWAPLQEWIEQARTQGMLKQEDQDLIFITNDLDKALRHVHDVCKHVMELGGQNSALRK